MIDLKAVREKVAAAAKVEGVNVAFPFAVEGQVTPPFVVLGMPTTDFDTEPCLDEWTLPVMVCVKNSTSNVATVTELETVWPRVAVALKNMIAADPTLGGIVVQSRLDRASFDLITVQGIDYPGQIIPLTLHGAS